MSVYCESPLVHCGLALGLLNHQHHQSNKFPKAAAAKNYVWGTTIGLRCFSSIPTKNPSSKKHLRFLFHLLLLRLKKSRRSGANIFSQVTSPEKKNKMLWDS